ncbi:hypothetical protein ACWEOE_37710 [Amycolatopsis sp. NPDC004368]
MDVPGPRKSTVDHPDTMAGAAVVIGWVEAWRARRPNRANETTVAR